MKSVKAVICDTDWFQVYDNMISFDETKVSSGGYWNYFLNIKKTISWSIFSNAKAWRDTELEPIASITAKVTQVQDYDTVRILVLGDEIGTTTARAAINLQVGMCHYKQGLVETQNGIAVQPYGAYLIPKDKLTLPMTLSLENQNIQYVSTPQTFGDLAVGDTVVFSPDPAATLLATCFPGTQAVPEKATKSTK